MPRFTVHVRDEWLTVPCKDVSNTVQWLGVEALRRYTKNKPDNGGISSVKDVRFYVRRCQGHGLLDADDVIEDVLEDNDFVEIVIEGDTKSPDFIPSQPGEPHLNTTYREPDEYILLDGNSLTTTDLVKLGKGLYRIKLTPEAEDRVGHSRELLENIVKENKVVYGITTGFGKFARTVIPKSKLKELQENLVRSHSAGLGKPLSPERSRMLLALRINVLAKGYSGISLDTLHQMIEAFNASCLSYIPEKGTVGASGDLAPLAHLALGLTGEGKMWSPKSGWADAKYVLEAHGLTPISLKPKEGLALINGTQMITSLGAEAVERAQAIARQADIIAALTLEVLKGTTRAFDSGIHELRPHPGQKEVAFRFRSLLDSDHHPSEIAESHRFCDRVQDAYTLRCCPQVHGVVNDTIEFVKNIINTEINSATDNPTLKMVFAERGETISGGNFHGEYPAKVSEWKNLYRFVANMMPWIKDRFMAPDIEAVHRLLLDQKASRHREKESRRDYMEKQREMFLVQYALSVKKDAMKRMEEDSAKEEQRLRLAEKQLEEDAIAFDRFIKENDQNSVEAVKIAENETMIKMEKTSKIKKATAKMMTIKSDISKNEEILSEYLLYKKFLTDVAPPEWRAEQLRKRELRRLARKKEEDKTRSKKVFFPPSPPKGEGKPPPAFSRRESKVGKVSTLRHLSRTLEKSTKPALYNLTDTKESVKEDISDDDEKEAEIYFTDPKQMLHILTELEEQNLTYIQNFQETEEAMDEIRKRVKLTQDKMEHETHILRQQIEMLKAAIQREEEKTSELELKSRIFSFGEFNAEKQDRMLSLLNKQVNEVYQTCIGDVGANISTLQMLTNIENKMEEVFECLETLPREKVEVVEANREKEMRIRLREEKLLLKKKHQEERLRLAVERVNADTKKRVGIQILILRCFQCFVRKSSPAVEKELRKIPAFYKPKLQGPSRRETFHPHVHV
ncbi:HUTH lyase, partial [Atractosteus spatula]|nr:HUTH lyase [Atractosteus spatula]